MEYHPYVLNHLDPVLAIQAKHNIVTQAYGPLTPVIRHPTGGPLVPVLEKIAGRLSKSTDKKVDAAGVLLQWTIQKGVVAVTTSGNPNNIRKMADGETFGEAGELTIEEMKEIEEVGRKVHFRSYKVSTAIKLVLSFANLLGTHDQGVPRA
jgi:diketogulonate reductase-like aldo/keto reductase